MTNKTVTLVLRAITDDFKRSIEGSKEALTGFKTKAEVTGRAASLSLGRANRVLDVKPYRAIEAEMVKVQAAFLRLKNSGTASMAELAQASLRVQTRMAALRGEMNGLGDNLRCAAAPLLNFHNLLIGLGITQAATGARIEDQAPSLGGY